MRTRPFTRTAVDTDTVHETCSNIVHEIGMRQSISRCKKSYMKFTNLIEV